MTTMTFDTLHAAEQLISKVVEDKSIIKQADFNQRFMKLEHEVDLKISDIRFDIQKLDTKIDKLEVSLNSKFDSKFDSIRHEIKYIKWAFGILIILLVIPLLKSLFEF